MTNSSSPITMKNVLEVFVIHYNIGDGNERKIHENSLSRLDGRTQTVNQTERL